MRFDHDMSAPFRAALNGVDGIDDQIEQDVGDMYTIR